MTAPRRVHDHPRHKGFAPGLRATIGDGRAPVRVIDATTALLLTPPAPFGVFDVHVQKGALTATLPKAFTYRSETFSKQWVEISMSTPRGNFPAMTTLQDGRVLIVGGTSTSLPGSSLNTAELCRRRVIELRERRPIRDARP